MTLSAEENDANMKLSQLKNIMNSDYQNTAGYIEKILETGFDINSIIRSTLHLESKQPKLIGCTALHLAFMEKCFEGFEELINTGADYTIKNRDGLTVLHQIVEDFYKNESMLRLDSEFATLIMSRHSNKLTNHCTRYGLSHFHAACLCNNAELVKSFLESGVSVDDAINMDAPCFPGYTPLHFAVRSYGYETVQVLIEQGANQNFENAEKKTPLLMLTEQKIKLVGLPDTSTMVPDNDFDDALDKHEKITKFLYQHNNNDCMNFSAFHLACTMKDTSLLENILEHGVDVNLAVNPNSLLWPGFTGLHFAALCNFDNVILLLKKGANIEARNAANVTPFDMCLNSCEPKDISKILSTVEIWKNIKLSDNQTTLVELVEAMSNWEQFEDFLEDSTEGISAIIPIDSVLWPGFTLLHVAVQLFMNIMVITIVDACLKAGADATAQSADGSSILHLAFRKEKMVLVDILLHDHSDQLSNLTDHENLSILHIVCAAELDHKEFARNLLRSGANVNVAYRGRPIGSYLRSGFTALHVAVASGNHEMVRELLEFGADRYAADSDGFTPLHWVLAAPDPDKVGAEFFVSIDDVRESIVSGLSHLHVASHVKDYQRLDNHKYTKNPDFIRKLLEMPHARVDVAVIYNENSSPSFLSKYAGSTPFYLAVKKKNWSTAEVLAKSGCDVLVRQPNGSVLLYDTFNECKWDNGGELILTWSNNERAQQRAQEDIGLTKLHLAFYFRDTDEEIERLLRSGENPNARIRADSPLWPGYTPLHVLARYGAYPHVMYHLSRKLELEFDYTLETANGETAAHLAYKNENENEHSLRELFDKHRNYSVNPLRELFDKHRNYSVNPANDAGLSYFHIACSTMNRLVVQEFLNAGVDVNRLVDPFFDDDSLAGQTPLHLALSPKRFGDRQIDDEDLGLIVGALLRNGARVNAKNALGETPLHKAVKLGKARADALEKLIEAGADVNALDIFCKDPWYVLLSIDDFSAKQLELFIEKGCRLNGYNPVDRVGYASLAFCQHGSRSEQKRLLFQAMLDHPQAIDTDERGCTVVHSFVANPETSLSCDEYAKLVEQLLILSENECDIDDQDDNGRTALHVAAYHGNHRAIEGLLIAGADINVADNDGDLTFGYLYEEDSDDEATVIARHVKMLDILKLTVSPKNLDFAVSVFERLDLDEAGLKGMVGELFELAKTVKITVGTYSLSLRNFLTETYSDMTINALIGDSTGKLIKQFFRNFKDDNFVELRSILKLQYRKAAARSSLVERASDALDRMSRCTVQCAKLIARFWTNDELGSVIAARMSIGD